MQKAGMEIRNDLASTMVRPEKNGAAYTEATKYGVISEKKKKKK